MVFDLQPPEDDGLHMDSVGSWSADKHHFLKRYIDAFTTSMKDRNWGSLHYIDLFAGAGIERIRGAGLEWGSPLIAAQTRLPFARIHVCEKNRKRFEALKERINRYPQPNTPQLIHGDANLVVNDILNEIPDDSLTLAFLDPFGLHLNFETIQQLSARRADLIIFFPDHLDALRNWENVYKGKPDSNLDRTLGTNTWLNELSESARDNWAQVLQDIYQRQIRSLTYTEFETERISNSQGRFLYKLLFCANHPFASELWRKTAKKHRDGQNMLFE